MTRVPAIEMRREVVWAFVNFVYISARLGVGRMELFAIGRCEKCSKLNSLRAGISAWCLDEKQRSHASTNMLGSVSYVWCACRGALCAAIRRPALGVTP